MVEKDNSFCCNAAPFIIFPCSGGSDVGEISDRTARKLTKDGMGKMYCLAGIGGRVSGIMESTKASPNILVIDGCPLNYAKKTMQEGGFANFQHMQLTDFNMPKGKTLPTDENIEYACQIAAGKIVERRDVVSSSE